MIERSTQGGAARALSAIVVAEKSAKAPTNQFPWDPISLYLQFDAKN